MTEGCLQCLSLKYGMRFEKNEILKKGRENRLFCTKFDYLCQCNDRKNKRSLWLLWVCARD